ncbi:MAG: amidohydrolase family protein [Bryobacteraceae bacterium]|nr:amidohydrolase family protein [Bryobacteraceae bacterium]
MAIPPKIDSHHHFWIYSPKEYGWMSDSMKSIRRNFLPADLQSAIAPTGINGVVSVQARQTLEETKFLLDHAAKHSFIKGVVGWVPLIDPQVGDLLANYMAQPKLRGVRHVLHDEADDRYMLRPDFQRGIESLHYFGLTYDLLIFEKHLPYAIELVDQHPQITFIVDHIAKPKIKERLLDPWRANIRELSKRPNVYCKVSGMVTEADWTKWTEADLTPYFDTVLEAFTPRRLMFGSDWPVCLVAAPYARWHVVAAKWIAKLSAAEQARIWGETAVAAYSLKV